MGKNFNDNKYKDLAADGVEGVVLDRLPPVPSRSYIKTKPEFDELPPEDRSDYWQSLASALNHALDVMQEERNKIIEICSVQEKQIEQLQEQHTQLSTALQTSVSNMNAVAQERAEELYKTKQKLVKTEADLSRLKDLVS